MGTKRYRGTLTLIFCCLHGGTANLVRNRSAPPKMLRDLRVNRIEPPRAMTRRCGLPGGQPQKTRKTARTSRGTLTASCPSSRARSARSGHPPVVLRPGGLAGGARRRSAHGARPCNDRRRRVARSSGMQAHAHAHAGHPSTVPPRRAPDHGTARADAPGEGHADFHAVRTRCHGPPRHHAEAPPSCAGKR